MSSTEPEDHLSEAEFEAAEGRLDKLDYAVKLREQDRAGQEQLRPVGVAIETGLASGLRRRVCLERFLREFLIGDGFQSLIQLNSDR
jgi:hypothetical protein